MNMATITTATFTSTITIHQTNNPFLINDPNIIVLVKYIRDMIRAAHPEEAGNGHDIVILRCIHIMLKSCTNWTPQRDAASMFIHWQNIYTILAPESAKKGMYLDTIAQMQVLWIQFLDARSIKLERERKERLNKWRAEQRAKGYGKPNPEQVTIAIG